jgi:hypothetical protein
MYYVIQILHEHADKHFVSFKVPKYIVSEKNQNIIFEFSTTQRSNANGLLKVRSSY